MEFISYKKNHNIEFRGLKLKHRKQSLLILGKKFISSIAAFSIAIGPILYSFSPQAVYAQQIIIDPSAPSGSAKLFSSDKGVPQIDIGTPNSGVSVNKFKNFNVGNKGLILNNSKSSGQSQIGGGVKGNSNLSKTGSAKVIVNEVTGTGNSTLAGTTEIFGGKAAVIIANPNGIGCNGCNFINTSRTTLTTGKPSISGNDIDLNVSRGTINIGSGGFTSEGDANLVGRHVMINGEVKADNALVISGGAQRFNHNSSSTKSAPTISTRKSLYAVDASEFGALTAGDIKIHGNESGLGVNVYGNIHSKGNVAINSAGTLFYKNITSKGKGVIHAKGAVRQYGDAKFNDDVTISAQSFTLYKNKKLETPGNVTINAADFSVIVGEIAADDITIKSATSVTNNGFVLAEGELVIVAGADIRNERKIATEYDTYYDPAISKYLEAYQAKLITGNADEKELAKQMIKRASAHQIIEEYVQAGATLLAENIALEANLDLDLDKLESETGDVINKGGAIIATQNITINAGESILNQYISLQERLDAEDGCDNSNCGYRTNFHAGEILAGGKIDLNAGLNIENQASDIAAAGSVTAKAGQDIINSLTSSEYVLKGVVGKVVTTTGYRYATVRSCTGGGKNFWCRTTQTLIATSGTVNVNGTDQKHVLAPGQIISLYGDVNLNSQRDFVSIGSEVSAGNNLNIIAEANTILTSFTAQETDYESYRTYSGLRQSCYKGFCRTGAGGAYNRVVGTNDFITSSTVLQGGNVNLISGDDIISSGSRIFAANDLNIEAVNGSILVESTDLPDNIVGAEFAEVVFKELDRDAASQILNDQDLVLDLSDFLETKQGQLMLAVAALEQTEDAKSLREVVKNVGLQSGKSLFEIDRDKLQTQIEAVFKKVEEDSEKRFDDLDRLQQAYIDEINKKISDIRAKAEFTKSDLVNLANKQLEPAKKAYEYRYNIYKRNLEYRKSYYSRIYGRYINVYAYYRDIYKRYADYYAKYAKYSSRYRYYSNVYNYYSKYYGRYHDRYVGYLDNAHKWATNYFNRRVTSAQTIYAAEEAKVYAQLKQKYGDGESKEQQITELQEQMDQKLKGFDSQREGLFDVLNSETEEAMRLGDKVLQFEAQIDDLSNSAIAKGTAQMGDSSAVAALVKHKFPEVGRISILDTDANGLIKNKVTTPTEFTREVTKVRDVYENQEITTYEYKRFSKRVGYRSCYKWNCYTYYRNHYYSKSVPVTTTQSVKVGTESYKALETYIEDVVTEAALLGEDKAKQDKLINALSWQFNNSEGLGHLSATPRSVLYADNDVKISTGPIQEDATSNQTSTLSSTIFAGLTGLKLDSFSLFSKTTKQNDIYFTGATNITAGNDLSIDADGTVGVLGAYNTGFDLADNQRNAFDKIGENLQLGTLSRATNDNEVGVVLDANGNPVIGRDGRTIRVNAEETGEGNLEFASRTRNYVLTNTVINAGKDVSINSGNDIINYGGSILSGENLYLTSEGDIRNEVLRHNFSLTHAHGCYSLACGREGHNYKPAEILAGSSLIASAGGSIKNYGSYMGGAYGVALHADEDIISDAITSQYLYHYVNISKYWGLKRRKELLYRPIIQSSNITSTYGDVSLTAGRDITNQASMISSGGDITLNAGNDIGLFAKSEEVHNYTKYRSIGFLSISQEKTRYNEFSTAYSMLEANNIYASAGNNLTGIGAQLVAATDISLDAGNNLTFDAHQNLRYRAVSGWSFGITFPGSNIISALIEDGWEAALDEYLGTNPLLAGLHKLSKAENSDQRRNGLIAIGYRLPKFIANVGENAGKVGSTRGTIENLVDGFFEEINPFTGGPFDFAGRDKANEWRNDPNIGGDKALYASFLEGITFRFSSYKSRDEWTESHVSRVTAGEDLNLYAYNDLALVGGTITSAAEDAWIGAGNDLFVSALADTHKSKSSSWGASIGFGAGGVTVGGSSNKATSNSTLYTNAAIAVGGELDMYSGRDMRFAGANVAADDIYIYAGRDLVVQSRQNISSSSSSGWNFSVTFSPAGITGLSFGGSRANANRQYTDTPTTIVAENTLDIYTEGTTLLLGAVLNSKTGDLKLDTGDFLFDNYNDVDQSKSSSFGVSLDLQDLAKSDAHGSYAYKDKRAITYATVGLGEINVRNKTDFDFSPLNRDVENVQRVTRDKSFELEIPGINLVQWVKDVKQATQVLKAVSADTSNVKKLYGDAGVVLYQRLMLNGLSEEEAREYINNGEFKKAVFEFNKIKMIEENGGVATRADLQVLALSELAIYEKIDNELAVRLKVDCELFGNCELIVRELSEIFDKESRERFMVTTLNKTLDDLEKDQNNKSITLRNELLVSALLACSVYEPEVYRQFMNQTRANGQLDFLSSLAGDVFGPDLLDIFQNADDMITQVADDEARKSKFAKIFYDSENNRNELLEKLVGYENSSDKRAEHLLMKSGRDYNYAYALIVVEDSLTYMIDLVEDPEERKRLKNKLNAAWDNAANAPWSTAGSVLWHTLYGIVAEVGDAAYDAGDFTFQSLLGEDPLDTGQAYSAASDLIAFGAAARALRVIKRSSKGFDFDAPNKGVDGFYNPQQWRKNYEDFYNGNVTSTTVPPFSAKNVHLAGKRHPETGVVYDQRGFPVFDDVAKYDTRFPSGDFKATDYQGQMRMATRDLRSQLDGSPQLRSQFTPDQIQAIQSGKPNIPDLTWHHHQDSGRMQLVPRTIHRQTGHVGGEALSGGQ